MTQVRDWSSARSGICSCTSMCELPDVVRVIAIGGDNARGHPGWPRFHCGSRHPCPLRLAWGGKNIEPPAFVSKPILGIHRTGLQKYIWRWNLTLAVGFAETDVQRGWPMARCGGALT